MHGLFTRPQSHSRNCGEEKANPKKTKSFKKETLFDFVNLATEQAPKFIREIKECRIKEGMRARFEGGFAGNPKPEITWYFKGQQLEDSNNIQIKVNNSCFDRLTKSIEFVTFHVYEVSMKYLFYV